MDPERNRAADRKALAAVREQAFKAEMTPVVGGRENAEEIHPVQVICAEQVEHAVAVNSVGAEFKAAPLVACVHDHCKKCPGAIRISAVAGDLHPDHGTGQDHVDRLRDIDKFSHTDLAEDRLEERIVRLMADCRVKSDARADVEQSRVVRVVGKRRGPGAARDGLVREGVQDRGSVVVRDPADIAGADGLAPGYGLYEFFPAFLYAQPPHEVISGSGLDKTDLGALKIADPVDHGVHCPVSAQNDQAALLAPRREIFADVFYFVLRGRIIYLVRHPALFKQGFNFVPLAFAAA